MPIFPIQTQLLSNTGISLKVEFVMNLNAARVRIYSKNMCMCDLWRVSCCQLIRFVSESGEKCHTLSQNKDKLTLKSKRKKLFHTKFPFFMQKNLKQNYLLLLKCKVNQNDCSIICSLVKHTKKNVWKILVLIQFSQNIRFVSLESKAGFLFIT